MRRKWKLFVAGSIIGAATVGVYAGWQIFGPQKPLQTRIKEAQRRCRVDLKRIDRLPTRKEQVESLKSEEFDVLIIGGGATGAGIALDSVSRGLRTALVEKNDFSSGTSSRSTKLIHGGVRYLEKAFPFKPSWDIKTCFGFFDKEQYDMVKEALDERANLIQIAPHLSYPIPILIPAYKYIDLMWYWLGLKMYDWVAGSRCLKKSYYSTKATTMETFPMLNSKNLKGAIVYFDGGQNDARMNLSIIISAARFGAATANYLETTSLTKNSNGQVCGATVRDKMTGEEFNVKAKCVINATGVFTDGIRQLDDPATPKIVAPAQGVHVVLPSYYSPGNIGLLDPKTSDGRVIFFLPWQFCTVAGTTDVPCEISDGPAPTEGEVQFILSEIDKYIDESVHVRRADVLSAWAGIRPLVKDPTKNDTQSIARNHVIDVSPSKLITIAGGKWTTYRHMAEEVVDRAIEETGLQPKRGCATLGLLLEGAYNWSPTSHIKLIQDFGIDDVTARHLSSTYGDKAYKVARTAKVTGHKFPVVGVRLQQGYPFLQAEVYYAMHEYACTAADILCRRTRLAFLNTEAAKEALPTVIQIMGDHLEWSEARRKEEYENTIHVLEEEMGLRLSRDITKMRKEQLKQSGMLTTQEKQEYMARFNSIDKDGKGIITINDLRKHLHKINQNISEQTLHEMLDEVDTSNHGEVTKQEYLQLMTAIKSGIITDSRFSAAALVTKEMSEIVSVERSAGGV